MRRKEWFLLDLREMLCKKKLNGEGDVVELVLGAFGGLASVHGRGGALVRSSDIC